MRSTGRLLAGFRRGNAGGLFRPTPYFLNTLDEYASITQLRQRLRQQVALGAKRMTTLDTETRLATELSRSPRPEERQEGLEMGEELWQVLSDRTTPVNTATRTAMRVNLCSAMRRCALISRDREAADLWTARFAERASRISPEDFLQTEEQEAMWRDPRAAEKPRPGTGITAEDLAEDAREAAEESGSSEAMGGAAKKQKRTTPMQDYRHQVFLDHPSFEYAFRHNHVRSPGPRYTG